MLHQLRTTNFWRITLKIINPFVMITKTCTKKLNILILLFLTQKKKIYDIIIIVF